MESICSKKILVQITHIIFEIKHELKERQVTTLARSGEGVFILYFICNLHSKKHSFTHQRHFTHAL